jgi:hypothetical protein
MIRTVEVLLVIIIIAGSLAAVSYFAVLPSPRQVSPMNLNRLSLTTLQLLDSDYDLSKAAFETSNVTVWDGLQIALSASLPPNVIYNLTVYDVNAEGGQLYTPVANISNAESLGAASDTASYSVTSSNVTFNVTPEKIGTTLYILNCSDANGWWITGYTAQSLAQDLFNLLSPYFVRTVVIQSTTQLSQILGGTSIQGETVQNALIINTYGESVPIPTSYCQAPYSNNAYAYYSYFLGQRVNLYNWTWVSIVGYPFYYVSNTVSLSSGQNGWGIYGMQMTGQGGSRAFLEGLNGQSYVYSDAAVTDSATRIVTLTQNIINSSNYYGIYPSIYQTSTRALSNSTLSGYNLRVGLNIFNPSGDYLAGAIYNHRAAGSTVITGSFMAVGLTRTPDIRVTGLGLLSYYQPRLYPSEYTALGTSRLVVLQLGLTGGS